MTKQEYEKAKIDAGFDKMNEADKKKFVANAITEMLRPEAKMAVELSKKNVTTKDGYATIMSAMDALPRTYKVLFLKACVLEGYPQDTADTLAEIYGII